MFFVRIFVNRQQKHHRQSHITMYIEEWKLILGKYVKPQIVFINRIHKIRIERCVNVYVGDLVILFNKQEQNANIKACEFSLYQNWITISFYGIGLLFRWYFLYVQCHRRFMMRNTVIDMQLFGSHAKNKYSTYAIEIYTTISCVHSFTVVFTLNSLNMPNKVYSLLAFSIYIATNCASLNKKKH